MSSTQENITMITKEADDGVGECDKRRGETDLFPEANPIRISNRQF